MRLTIISTLVLVTGIGYATTSWQDGATAPAASAPAAAEPGPFVAGTQHRFLQELAGEWDAVVTMVDPTGAESVGKGKLVRSRLADFHVVDSYEGEAMGMKLIGHGTSSFCPARGKFVSTWMDSMTPSPLVLEGDYDASKRELVMTGESLGMSGTLEPCRAVTKFRDADHFSWALYAQLQGGAELLCVSVEYTRAKK